MRVKTGLIACGATIRAVTARFTELPMRRLTRRPRVRQMPSETGPITGREKPSPAPGVVFYRVLRGVQASLTCLCPRLAA